MYKDSSCRSSPQPPPLATATATATATTSTATTTTTTTSEDVADTTACVPPEINSTTNVSHTTTTTSTSTYARCVTLENDIEDGFSCPSESSSDSEYDLRSSRPSTASTTSTSSSSAAAGPAVGAPCLKRQKRTTANAHAHANAAAHRSHINSDVRLLRKIGYIASRVRFLAKIYGDFKLVNPYSPAKQKRLLQEILLKHSIHDPERELARTENLKSQRSLTPASSIASSYCCLPQNESSFEDDSVTGTVRRKSSTSVTTTASNFLLEDLLIQLYEDRRKKVTVIRRRRSRRSSVGATKLPRNHLIIMSSKTTSSSVERLLQLDNEDEGGGGGGVGGVVGSESSDRLTKGTNIYNANITTTTAGTTTSSQHRSSTAFLQPIPGDENLKRRRASDCTPSHPGQPLTNQLQITLKNNNCTKFPLHRGSCGAAGEHLLAANSIANRQTLILSKSCGNVDAGLCHMNAGLYGSADLRNLTVTATTVTGSSVTTTTGSANVSCSGTAVGGGNGISGTAQANGNNEYSIVQLNNTIIQCHFNDEDFRALVKDLKRKVEYTERMNWLCFLNGRLYEFVVFNNNNNNNSKNNY